MQDLDSLSLLDITPQNISQDENISSIISALDPEMQELSHDSLEPLILARIDELPEQVIDLLAWQLHVDFYDLAGTLYMKREAVKGSIMWHMHKGTVWAIMEALRMIDIQAEFVHWHDDNSAPYTFKLRAIVSGDFYRTKGRDQLQASIRRAVEESKAARSYLAGLETQIYFHEDVDLFTGIIPFLSGNRRILLDKPDLPDQTEIYHALVSALQGHSLLGLYREREINANISISQFTIENRDVSLGSDKKLMQELLRQFEQRIFARIDESERRTTELINAHHADTDAKLNNIMDMLLWTGPLDDELEERI